MDELVKVSHGDLRTAITYLQTANTLFKDEVITIEFVRELAGVITVIIFISIYEREKWETINKKNLLKK